MIRAAVSALHVALVIPLATPDQPIRPVAASQPAPSTTIVVDDRTADDSTRPTLNEFYPEARPLSDCLSSLPKPDCGSEGRGGWAQTTIFLALIAGLGFIAWRIVAGARRARRTDRSTATAVTTRSGTPDATTARDGDGGAPAP